jgi:cullin-4
LVGFLVEIEKDRLGETVDKNLLRNLCRMYISLGIYHNTFEGPFIEASDSFYTKEFSALVQNVDVRSPLPVALPLRQSKCLPPPLFSFLPHSQVPQYMLRVERRTAEEDERLSTYLDPSTRKSLMATLDRCCIIANVDIMISRGLETLLDENRIADLQRMFGLLSRVSAIKAMRTAWLEYIKRRGGAIVLVDTKMDTKKAPEGTDKEKLKAEREKAREAIIDGVLAFKAKMDDILNSALHKNEDFYEALKEGFEKFLNINAKDSAELLARYIHRKLQSKDLGSDQEMEASFDKLVHIFRCLTQKADFETYYRVHLGKRLLLGRVANIDAERTMIEKLKGGTSCFSVQPSAT